MEQRRYWTISDPEYLAYLNPKGQWAGLGSIGLVEAERTIGQQTSQETRDYLSSLSGSAKEFGRAVLRRLALNLLRREHTAKVGIKAKRLMEASLHSYS